MVSISPGSAVYGMFPSFNYRHWLALGEFVDNSISSYEQFKKDLRDLNGESFVLKIFIDFDESLDKLSVRDNAAGISVDRFEKAFALATPPENLDYINRYGVGMKAAACWFARDWSLRTTAIGENVERTIEWSTTKIINEKLLELEPEVKSAKPDDHYTILTLKNLIHPPRGMTISKIKSFLPNIYREFLRNGEVEIFWNNELLSEKEPEILSAPPAWDLDGAIQTWDQDLVLNMPDGRTINGRVFLLKKMDRKYTALNLFWRNRLILGNVEPNHRPWDLFGEANSFEAGRLCVELKLDDYEPTLDKQGFKWKDTESSLEEIIVELQHVASEILRQAEKYRKPEITKAVPIPNISRFISSPTEAMLEHPKPPTESSPYPHPKDDDSKNQLEPVNTVEGLFVQPPINLEIDGMPWVINLQIGNRNGDNQLVAIEEIEPDSNPDNPRHLYITLGLRHPFASKFWRDDSEIQRLMLFFASALGLAEIAARKAGAKLPSYVRSNLDEFLKQLVWNNEDPA
jgi:hypothetical protein